MSLELINCNKKCKIFDMMFSSLPEYLPCPNKDLLGRVGCWDLPMEKTHTT